MEIAVLLKNFQYNKKGTYGYVTEEGDMFVFNGFMVSREMVEDNPDTFKLEGEKE